MKKIYGYARVSSIDQCTDRQVEALLECGVNDRDIIIDKASGKNLERKGYYTLKEHLLREGDTLIVKSLDRLSRNKQDIKNELEYYRNNGIRIKIIDLPTTMLDIEEEQSWVLDMVNNILLEVLSSIAEQERITIRQRQEEGIRVAKKNGKKFGRPKIKTPSNWVEVYSSWERKEIGTSEALELLQLKKSSFYNMVKEYKAQGIVKSDVVI